MNRHEASPLLRRTLLVDATVSGVTGLAMLLGATALEEVLGLPVALARGAGIALLPFAALVFQLSRRQQVPRASVVTVIAVNVAWVVASLALVVAGGVGLTGLGAGFVLAQALGVAAFAALQYAGLQRSPWRDARTA
jgi:hypothetical protein